MTVPAPAVFHQGAGGNRVRVYPGNDQFITRDRIERQSGGAGNGSAQGDASPQGEGEDSFSFTLSKDEYLDLLFDDLELPRC